jgi:transcription elongation factor Elf1
MAKGDPVILTCPYCGKQSTYQIRGNDVHEVHHCKHCSRGFSVEVTNGQVRGVRK